MGRYSSSEARKGATRRYAYKKKRPVEQHAGFLCVGDAQVAQVCVRTRAEREVVSPGHDLDAVGERALPPHILLEGGRSGAPHVHLAVERDDDEQRLRLNKKYGLLATL